jgi:predicted amidophosphoribosyltransferase
MDQTGAGIVSAIMGLAFIVVMILIVPAKKCQVCGAKLPKFRKPQGKDQALHGGWICPNCGASLDHNGKKVDGA